MPTIDIRISDLAGLLSQELKPETLEEMLKLVKGELKAFDPDSDQAKVELNDSNRPDLWCPEGIARQIRWVEKGQSLGYPHYAMKRRISRSVRVAEGMEAVRPYICVCAVRGVTVSEEVLVQLIQTQEKLSEIYGRRREAVSIGLYRLKEITFPVHYRLVDPDETRLVPLGFDESMSLREILKRHPKGIAYGGLLSGFSQYPVLMDALGRILSFPPIINSRGAGEVRVGDRDLLVEATGTDLRLVMLALNIMACNLIDRGGVVDVGQIRYPYRTAYGSKVECPRPLSTPISMNVNEAERALGISLSTAEIKRDLSRYGFTVIGKGKRLNVTPPLYRDDVMHPIDLIEDIAIVHGYDRFVPEMPTSFTVGKLSEIERFSDAIRDRMVGLSFQEVVSNILTSKSDLLDRMNRSEISLVEVANPMVESYAVVRDWIIPSLLSAEAQSSKAFYPHRIFEAGEVARMGGEEGTETRVHLSALLSHASANFSELHAVLEALFYYLMVPYRLEPAVHPSFLEGRLGRIYSEAGPVGWIGEIHPQVLERWEIGMPVTAFEIELDDLC